MAQRFFDLINYVFKLMAENKLKKDIDDTLLEKLLTLIQNCRLVQSSDTTVEVIVIDRQNNKNSCSYFINELTKRTEAVRLIEKVLSSVVLRNNNNSAVIKSFVIRFLGVIFENSEDTFPYEKLLPLLKHANDTVITDHIPSIQDALLFCLSCVTKQIKGALWFINKNLTDFVFSSFKSSSYYVRKSAMNFFINFISKWTQTSDVDQRKTHELCLENSVKDLVSLIIDNIHFYTNSQEIDFAECCIGILKQLLESEDVKIIMKDPLNLAKNISDCFTNLSEEKELNRKLADLFLAVHFKFALPIEVINDAIKYLIMNEDLKLAMELASSFASRAWSKQSCPDEIQFFMLPVYILLNTPLTDCESFFMTKSDDIYRIFLKKMEDKTECKALFSLSLSSLKKVMPQLNSDVQKSVVLEILKITKCSNYPHHKWLYLVLEDRIVHHSLLEFYSSLLSEDVYLSLKYERTDLIFQTIMEFLKKPTPDSNFLSQLLLLMKDLLILHKKYEIDLEEDDRSQLIQILCRVLHDNRESVVDSAIHLAGQIICFTAWQGKLSKQGIHSIIWDIAIQGSLDGTVRSTALKVIIDNCLEDWCLKEVKSLKNITEEDIAKILFDLTYDPDFFLQREALSCLFQWIKSKWNELPPICMEYLYTALVSAVKSLDLELKLISLDIWMWLLENKFKYSVISPSLDLKDYVKYLATSGFGLSMVLAVEDYDKAVQYKASTILHELKKTLISNGTTFDSHQPNSDTAYDSKQCIVSEKTFKPFSKEERDKGIDTVMELSTTEQITNICRPLSEFNDTKHCYFSSDIKKRTCTIYSFWTCLWSEKVVLILQPTKAADITDGESLLKDIISARVMEHDSIEDTPDCY